MSTLRWNYCACFYIFKYTPYCFSGILDMTCLDKKMLQVLVSLLMLLWKYFLYKICSSSSEKPEACLHPLWVSVLPWLPHSTALLPPRPSPSFQISIITFTLHWPWHCLDLDKRHIHSEFFFLMLKLLSILQLLCKRS